MKNYSVTRDISIPELVEKVRIVFKDNQYLFDGFAPFVLPEQAAACGLVSFVFWVKINLNIHVRLK